VPIGARRSFGSWLGMPKVASAQRPRPESSGSETQGSCEVGALHTLKHIIPGEYERR
jgi:hypothetical protein